MEQSAAILKFHVNISGIVFGLREHRSYCIEEKKWSNMKRKFNIFYTFTTTKIKVQARGGHQCPLARHTVGFNDIVSGVENRYRSLSISPLCEKLSKSVKVFTMNGAFSNTQYLEEEKTMPI